MFIKAIYSRLEKKLYFVENVTIHGRNLNKKIRRRKYSNQCIIIWDYQSIIIHKVSKETLKRILKYIMKEFQTWSIQSEKNKQEL